MHYYVILKNVSCNEFLMFVDDEYLANRLIESIELLETALLRRQQQQQQESNEVMMAPQQASSSSASDTGEVTTIPFELQQHLSNINRMKQVLNEQLRNGQNDDETQRLFAFLADRIENLRRNFLRRNAAGIRKRNYNLDHLARMNFRRSFRASSALNDRHILGGL